MVAPLLCSDGVTLVTDMTQLDRNRLQHPDGQRTKTMSIKFSVTHIS